ncbi:MAG: hypothetical protein ABI702_07255 [Burkholderiales bacterium]
MKAMFGVVSLLLALVLVGLVVSKQLKAARPAAAVSVGPGLSGSGPVGQQARQLERQVADDVTKAMAQGAARRDEAEK